MRRMIHTLCAVGIVATIIGSTIMLRKSSMIHAMSITTSAQAQALFPKTISDIDNRIAHSLAGAHEHLAALLAVAPENRTYENTMQAFDDLCATSDLVVNSAIFSLVDMVYPDANLRDAARAAVLQAQNFFIEHISSNKKLYAAIKEYADTHCAHEGLSDEQRYFIEETIHDFERAGLNLPDAELTKITHIKKELAALELEFDKNIAQDNQKITVEAQGLEGLSQQFIENLKKTDEGNYLLGVDYPTFLQVMENCIVTKTRKDLLNAYQNRAYPINKSLLEKIISLRSTLAQHLGFKSYADLELDSQMVRTVARAHTFLDGLNQKAQQKAAVEFATFTKHLPPSVTLSPDGKLYPWDTAYVKNQYKKNQLNLDENAVAHYFPMQKTVDGLLKVYEQFLDLQFKQIPVQGLWDADVRLVEVIQQSSGASAGYLYLDLFPRDNKYSHACELTLVPVTYNNDGNPNKGVAVVIANFPKPSADRPSLLHLKDVNTFFHEFGHAMHALLGRTKIASQSGTNVKRDFVELPSQMLEEWLWDPEILTLVSSHYQTGEPLPAPLIQRILATRTYDSGNFIVRQLFFANLALAYFENGPDVNVDAVMRKLYQEYMYKIEFYPEDHFYASFGHLIGYGARYYGYMWSKVFSHDLFAEIKKIGLLSPEAGARYTTSVIGKGGSKDPNALLHDFLGREPNQDAFLKDMGLESAQ